MWFSPIFERFVEKSPVTVIRGGPDGSRFS